MSETEYPRISLTGFLVTLLATAVGVYVSTAPDTTVFPFSVGDSFFLSWVGLHGLGSLWFLYTGFRRRFTVQDLAPVGEGLFFYGLFLFIFVYIFALNANMDYVQRFIESGGNLQLALDTATERRLALMRFGPLLVMDLLIWFLGERSRSYASPVQRWSAPLILLAVVLSFFSMPNPLALSGWGFLGWVSLVPVVMVLRVHVEQRQAGRAVWYGVLYGVLFTILGNFWLGTFALVSLQAVAIIFLGFYGILMSFLVLGLRHAPRWARVLIIPLGWTAWELLRSSGFLGYPWLLVAHSQYRNIPLIQIAEFGGVWLVSFVVLLVNSMIAEFLLDLPAKTVFRVRRVAQILLVPALAMSIGAWLLLIPIPTVGEARLALIQQNTDPRKHEYAQTLDVLTSLTEEAMRQEPDMVVWSETAFVPNIRRWSQEDPRRYSLARLVQEFNQWQEELGTWLLTGNDDYTRVFDEDGHETQRNSFNAAVLLDPWGERRKTYHKIRLVPFTEHFPYEAQLPWVYNMLQDFDVAFWTPGTEYTVFDHPQFRFATPICFEDVFPREVRQFAQAGMQVIVNISNDYWSLQETAAKQHFVASLFRTVELRRPMVRSTASGVTAHVSPRGEILATVPQYSEQILIADVPIPRADNRVTFYQLRGDWFPLSAAALFFLLIFVGRGRGASGWRGRGRR